MSDRLRRLHSEQGQSPWLDNLQRAFVQDGTLRTMLESGIRGLTSNPTIFQKAIQGSNDYDEQFTDEIVRGLSAEEAYWELVSRDITDAARVFAPLYEESHGGDGYVSVEVDPRLAHDGVATLAAARELHEKLSLPNVMIKIPATQAGIPAIRMMIAEGRNVNVTLIFSLERYDAVMHAYLDGLEDRLDAGLSVAGVASVASFFISRVDSEIDKRLDLNGGPEALALRGTAAVNQAKIAYANFRAMFSGPRWERLAAAGARVQRPLWASTSTKNPAYPDTLYVDQLIGPDTVNTLPDATVSAFADHGTVARTIDTDVQTARDQWRQLSDVGVDLADVSTVLESEGVASFIKSFDDLMSALRDKALGLGGR